MATSRSKVRSLARAAQQTGGIDIEKLLATLPQVIDAGRLTDAEIRILALNGERLTARQMDTLIDSLADREGLDDTEGRQDDEALRALDDDQLDAMIDDLEADLRHRRR